MSLFVLFSLINGKYTLVDINNDVIVLKKLAETTSLSFSNTEETNIKYTIELATDAEKIGAVHHLIVHKQLIKTIAGWIYNATETVKDIAAEYFIFENTSPSCIVKAADIDTTQRYTVPEIVQQPRAVTNKLVAEMIQLGFKPRKFSTSNRKAEIPMAPPAPAFKVNEVSAPLLPLIRERLGLKNLVQQLETSIAEHLAATKEKND